MLQRTTTTVNGRRSPSDPTAETAYRFVTAPGWPASRLGWIRPGSGSAWPDPACLSFFFFFCFDLFKY
jgi:hypothetical protein